MQDTLAAARAQVAADGMIVTGAQKQPRPHPLLAEIRALVTESRLTEIELGLTPASASKCGVPAVPAPSPLDKHLARRRAHDEDDDPRIALIRDHRTGA